MEARLKIKLNLSPLDKALELAGTVFLFLMWAITIYTFIKSPPTIPIHYDGYGKPNGYGDKMTVWILPILATAIYLGLTFLNKYPHIFNYMTEITVENAKRQYTLATRLLRYLKLAIVVTFSFDILFGYLTAIGLANGLSIWSLPITIVLLIIPVIISITKSLNKKKAV
jgi:uncharacterized membrane protein